MEIIDLSGIWDFQLDEEMNGLVLPFTDKISLPSTTSFERKGKVNENYETGFLTDKYKFEGFAWFEREITLPKDIKDKQTFLYLERTRITRVWLNDIELGSKDSLNGPHIYNLSDAVKAGNNKLTICVDNVNYKTKGGHMTSPDTQSNWNGITGKIMLEIYQKSYIKDVQIYPSIKDKKISIKLELESALNAILKVKASSYNTKDNHSLDQVEYKVISDKIEIIDYYLGQEAKLWSEFDPALYLLELTLVVNNEIVHKKDLSFGLREFATDGDKFTINGKKTFLRGKHDGLLFPKTAYAPTTVNEWLDVLRTAKSYGINHYRFHTACPPDAAFTAADLLGIYMEPELPFWGTITDEDDPSHNKEEQEYLIKEGYRILKNFANHPSFVMMSLGNELWGSKERINQILKNYKTYDNRPLYTQGSNNFQFYPQVLDEEDFYCGVRCSKNRLFRGSYAQCDAPLGHVQTDEPSTMKDYDEALFPTKSNQIGKSNKEAQDIQIQYGTKAKTIKAVESDGIIPNIPVISHEIGQYATFPNFDEIDKYTGPLKARNLQIFKKRLEEKNLLDLAKDYFYASGKLAVRSYKEELEAAFRTRKIAGFQILDLQDFTGQGTALVGILDSFMDPKGSVTAKEWRSFCLDAVLLSRFEKYNYESNENFKAHIELVQFKNIDTFNTTLIWEIKDKDKVYLSGKKTFDINSDDNYIDICDIDVLLPSFNQMKKLTFYLRLEDMDVEKDYFIWVYPEKINPNNEKLHIVRDLSNDTLELLNKGENVILIPDLDKLSNAIEGFYCTDFWNYPMFRSISESMNKKVPVGTMGLLIDNKHPIFDNFPTQKYSTYPWWNLVMNSKSIILDDLPSDLKVIVQTIDNFERNHKLGMIFECKVSKGNLLVCNCDFTNINDKIEVKQFMYSMFEYVRSDKFRPSKEIDVHELKKVL